MNKFTIIANGKELDTYDNVNISFNYQIEDILDITKKKSNYSKTITLPGTSFNNNFFKQLFDVNIDNVTFNPKKAIPCVIQIGNSDIMSGNLQLLNVVSNQKQVDYEVVILGQLKNIMTQFDDYSLKNLDLSKWDHIRSQENIVSSWNYDVIEWNTLNSYSEPGNGYVYPYIIYGQHSDIYSHLYTSDIFPAFYLKTIIDEMFNFAGYTYTSKFFNSDYFKKLILPFNEDKLQLSEEEFNQRKTVIGIDGTINETTYPLRNFYTDTYGDISTATGYRAISTLRINSPGWFYNDFQGYWIPLERESGLYNDVTFQDPLGSWFELNQDPTVGPSYAYYECQQSGYYDINFDANVIMRYVHEDGNDIEYDGGSTIKMRTQLLKVHNGSTISLDDTGSIDFTPSTGSYSSPWKDTQNPISIDVSASNIFLYEGDRLYIRFGFNYGGCNWDGNDQKVFAQALLPTVASGKITAFNVIPSNNTLAGIDDAINVNQVIPDMKMKDLFVSIIKMFNLVVVDDPNDENNLIIEPRDDYYKSRQKVLDWTYKLDHNSDITITPMSELDANSFLYTYKQDSDYYNEQYDSETGRIYGDYEIDVDNDFSDKEEKLELAFAPTPNGQWGIWDRIAPFFTTIDDLDIKPKKVKPRILFYGGLVDMGLGIYLKDFVGQALVESTFMEQYPYCGMWDNPYTPTYDLGFGTTDKIYFNANYYPVNNLIEQFHKNTLLDIIDVNSKLLEASFYLTPKDIAELDFRDIILIDNSYWRINKIKDYDPIGSDSLTKVILYKINDVNIFNPDTEDLAISNDSCPSDIRAVKTIQGVYYISDSGQPINEDCCSALGGDWIGGTCWYRTKWETISYNEAYKTLVKKGSNNITPTAQVKTEKEFSNNNSVDSFDVTVKGFNNVIGPNVQSSAIYGDNNGIVPQSNNIQLYGNNNTVNTGINNAIILGNNSSIELPSLLSGATSATTATSLNNVVIFGDNIVATEPNTLYTNNIIMTSGSTINGTPITTIISAATPTLDFVLGNGNQTLGNDILMTSGDVIESTQSVGYLDLALAGDQVIELSVSDGTITDSLQLDPGIVNNGTELSSLDTVSNDKSGLYVDPQSFSLYTTDDFTDYQGTVESNYVAFTNTLTTQIKADDLLNTNQASVTLQADIGAGTTDINIVADTIDINGDLEVDNISFDAGTTYWVFKEINIGDWDMDATASVNVAHGLSATEWKTIRQVDIIIRNDADTGYYPLRKGYDGVTGNGFVNVIGSTNITLNRVASGDFDNTNFDSTSYNRGWVTFWYKPD